MEQAAILTSGDAWRFGIGGIVALLLRADFTVAIEASTTSSNATIVWGPAAGVTYADVMVDLQAEPNLQTTSNTTYFNSDTVHLTNAGYAIWAADVVLGLASIGVGIAV
jgi:lysophospholipase L1-like esterase